MAVYTQLANETIAQVLHEDYGLSAFDFAVGIAEGVENSNYLVVTNEKDVEKKYILTLYEKRVSREDLPFFLNLMQHLAQAGIACPQPLLRRDGSLVGEVAGRAAALVSFVPGHSHTVISVADVASVGEALAGLHRAAADFKPTRANALSLAGWRSIFSKIEGKLDTLEAGFSAMVREELAYLEMHWPKDLPRGVIHADLFPNNVFFIDARVSGIIDFYFACTDFFAYDTAITLNAWCFDGVAFNAKKSHALLSHYEKHRPLSAAEKAAMPVLLRGAALRFFLTRTHDLIFHETGALVTPLDPMEYAAKLRFHQTNESWVVGGGQ